MTEEIASKDGKAAEAERMRKNTNT